MPPCLSEVEQIYLSSRATNSKSSKRSEADTNGINNDHHMLHTSSTLETSLWRMQAPMPTSAILHRCPLSQSTKRLASFYSDRPGKLSPYLHREHLGFPPVPDRVDERSSRAYGEQVQMQLPQLPQHVSETELVSCRKSRHFVEPEAHEQVCQRRVLPYNNRCLCQSCHIHTKIDRIEMP